MRDPANIPENVAAELARLRRMEQRLYDDAALLAEMHRHAKQLGDDKIAAELLGPLSAVNAFLGENDAATCKWRGHLNYLKAKVLPLLKAIHSKVETHKEISSRGRISPPSPMVDEFKATPVDAIF